MPRSITSTTRYSHKSAQIQGGRHRAHISPWEECHKRVTGCLNCCISFTMNWLNKVTRGKHILLCVISNYEWTESLVDFANSEREIGWISHYHDFLSIETCVHKKAGPSRGPAGGHSTELPSSQNHQTHDLGFKTPGWMKQPLSLHSQQPFPTRSLTTSQSSFGLVRHVTQSRPISTVQTSGHSNEFRAGTWRKKLQWESIVSLLLKQPGKRSSFPSPAIRMARPWIVTGYPLKGQPDKEASSQGMERDQVLMTSSEPLDTAKPEAVPLRYYSFVNQSSPFLKPVSSWVSVTCVSSSSFPWPWSYTQHQPILSQNINI